MDWIKWLIPLIALAVWVLSNLARNREEPRRGARPSSSTGGSSPDPPTPRRRSSEEIVVARVVSESLPPSQRAGQAAPAVSVTARRLGPTAAPKQILQLLRNPQALARAIVIREILDPPLSRRPHRRARGQV